MDEGKESFQDDLFLVVVSCFVLLTQVGFTLLEAGVQSTKNTTNIMIKNTVNLFITILVYWAVGYAFAWGGNSNLFISHSNFFLSNVPRTSYAFCLFQLTLAANANIIVSGALTARNRFWTNSIQTVTMTGVIYPLASHWAWHKEGWLNTSVGLSVPYKDMAGSSVISVVAGTMGLIGTILLGPRQGRFQQGCPSLTGSHIAPMCMLGSFFTFLGYLAVIAGSGHRVSNSSDITTVISSSVFNGLIGASGGALTAYGLRRTCAKCYGHHLPLLSVLFGATAGIVSVCAGGQTFYHYGSFVVGVFGGLSYISWAIVLVHSGIDDPMDTVAVHLGCGSWGVIAAVLFDKDEGVLFMGDTQSFKSLGWNMLGLVVMFVWSLLLSSFLFVLLKITNCFRLSKEDEQKGLDIVMHNEPAYPMDLDRKPSSSKHSAGAIQSRHSPDSQQDSGTAELSTRSSPLFEEQDTSSPQSPLDKIEVTRL